MSKLLCSDDVGSLISKVDQSFCELLPSCVQEKVILNSIDVVEDDGLFIDDVVVLCVL